MSFSSPSARFAAINKIAERRILVLDGAMGTLIQGYSPSEEDYRGETYAAHPSPLKGNNELLSITRPDIISAIHKKFLEAGADIIETNTFNANRISQADYHLEHDVVAQNYAAVKLARAACLEFETDEAPKLVAGSIGPTNKTLSLSPDVNDPAFRAVSFDEVVIAYEEQIVALMDSGVDLLLVETIFDTLVAKACIFAIENVFERRGETLPIMISGTITDRSGRTLSGQTVEAFYNSLAHANPWSIGLNCALGPKEMRPFLADLSRVAACKISVHPNAGLPNAFGAYDETPDDMFAEMAPWAADGLVNIVGGCCGTTPDHIAAIARAAGRGRPRNIPTPAPMLRLSGLEPFNAPA